MQIRRALLSAMLVALTLTSALAQERPPEAKPPRFAEQIEAYLKADQTQPPPRDGILFIGSSIFRLWKNLAEQMAPLPVFNRAFGGSQTHEILAAMDRLVLPCKPQTIVYYCGSNDINANVPPDRIAGNFAEFVRRVRVELPQTKIFYVSINRAPQKIDKWQLVDEANQLVRQFCEKEKGLRFIDVNPALFDAEGRPRMELYLADKLHFKDEAYVEFTKIIKPILAADHRSGR